MNEDLEEVRRIISEADPKSVVFFGGAGVSTESGIPDFRSAKGIFNEAYPYPPEVIVGHSFFEAHPDVFYDFYRAKMVHEDAKPNQAHKKLAELEQQGILRSVITQNVDGLHQAAGSKCVHELHGSIHRNYCMKCGKRYGLDAIMKPTVCHIVNVGESSDRMWCSTKKRSINRSYRQPSKTSHKQKRSSSRAPRGWFIQLRVSLNSSTARTLS